jgi:hypothetical protein
MEVLNEMCVKYLEDNNIKPENIVYDVEKENLEEFLIYQLEGSTKLLKTFITKINTIEGKVNFDIVVQGWVELYNAYKNLKMDS